MYSLIFMIVIIVAAVIVGREPKSFIETHEEYKDLIIYEIIDLFYGDKDVKDDKDDKD